MGLGGNNISTQLTLNTANQPCMMPIEAPAENRPSSSTKMPKADKEKRTLDLLCLPAMHLALMKVAQDHVFESMLRSFDPRSKEAPHEPMPLCCWYIPKMLAALSDAKMFPVKLASLKHQESLCNPVAQLHFWGTSKLHAHVSEAAPCVAMPKNWKILTFNSSDSVRRTERLLMCADVTGCCETLHVFKDFLEGPMHRQ